MTQATRKTGQRLLAATLAALQLLPAATAHAQQTGATQYEYDAQGNLTKITDPNGKATVQTLDSLDRLQSQSLPKPSASAATPQVNYSHDGRDRLSSVTDPRGNTTTYVRTGLDNVLQTSPDTGQLYRQANTTGAVGYGYNHRDQSLTITYDALNRPTAYTYTDEDSSTTKGLTQLTYDESSTVAGSVNYGVGRLTKVVEYKNTATLLAGQTLRYDQLGRVTRSCQFVSGASSGTVATCADTDAVGYRWDASATDNTGHLLGLTYPSGRLVNYQYDSLGHISAITTTAPGTSTTAAVISSVAYTPLAVAEGGYAPKSWNFGATPTTPQQSYRRFYDTNGLPSYFSIGRGVIGVANTGYQISRDDAGRILSIIGTTSGAGSQLYTYDDLDRLTQANLNGTSYNYSYDLNGNRTLKTAGTTSTTYSYPATSNQVASVKVGTAASQGVTTDTTGNVTQDPASPAGLINYSYDDRTTAPYGRLVRSQGPGAQFDYLHNHWGQRIRKTGSNYTTSGGSTITPPSYIGSADTLFYHDLAGHLIAELDAATHAVKREYIWLGDTPVAVIAGTTPTAQVTASGGSNPPAVYYIHTDHLDTPRLISDTAGNRRWDWSQLTAEPFGNSPPSEAPAGQVAAQQFVFNLRFPGQYLDKETGSFYNYFRSYNPATGRYLQSDPIGLAGGTNTYGYVGGNPLSRIDPTGQIAIADDIVIGGAVLATGCLLSSGCRDAVSGAISSAANAAAAAASSAADAIKEACSPNRPCQPCRTVSGRTVPVDTIGYRPLDVIPDDQIQHGVAGSHHNIFIAKQNPNNCQCFWAKQKYVLKPGQLPPGAVPVEPFVN